MGKNLVLCPAPQPPHEQWVDVWYDACLRRKPMVSKDWRSWGPQALVRDSASSPQNSSLLSQNSKHYFGCRVDVCPTESVAPLEQIFPLDTMPLTDLTRPWTTSRMDRIKQDPRQLSACPLGTDETDLT